MAPFRVYTLEQIQCVAEFLAIGLKQPQMDAPGHGGVAKELENPVEKIP